MGNRLLAELAAAMGNRLLAGLAPGVSTQPQARVSRWTQGRQRERVSLNDSSDL